MVYAPNVGGATSTVSHGARTDTGRLVCVKNIKLNRNNRCSDSYTASGQA